MATQRLKNMPYQIDNETESIEDFPNPMDFLDEEISQSQSLPKPKKTCKKHSQEVLSASDIESNELQQPA